MQMANYKFIIFPIGEHDTAGNKRLKNLTNYLAGIDNVRVIFFNPSLEKAKEYSGLISLFYKFIFQCRDWFNAVQILFREKERGTISVLYFYEGRQLLLHRIIIAKLLRYQVIVDLVEHPDAFSHTRSYTQKFRILYFLLVYKLIPHFTQVVVVVSHFLRKKIEEDFKGRVPVYLLPVSYDPADFSHIVSKNNSPSVFYGGSYGSNYDFESLFQAFSTILQEVPELKLYLSGNPDNAIKQRIYEIVPATESVIFLGFLGEKEYFRTICKMDILCMPRNDTIHANAGFPFKLAEYLATGNPVITSRVSDIKDYITEEDAFIYNPGDSREIENHLRTILQEPERAHSIGLNGREKASRYFNSETIAHDFFEYLVNQIRLGL
jgi:glycosyltransferase involved in cell wall biosynthesis